MPEEVYDPQQHPVWIVEVQATVPPQEVQVWQVPLTQHSPDGQQVPLQHWPEAQQVLLQQTPEVQQVPLQQTPEAQQEVPQQTLGLVQ